MIDCDLKHTRSVSMISRRALLTGAGSMAAAAALGPPFWPQAAAAGMENKTELIPAWDAHVHLGGLPGSVPQRVAALLKHADRVGVEKIVVFMGTTWASHPTPDKFRRDNDEVLQAIAAAPDRVMGFVYLNPRYERECLAELDRCVRDGPMVGVKLWIAMTCDRPELEPIARRSGELHVPILQHAYWRVGEALVDESRPPDMAVLAARHPQTSFICAHTGNDWERGIRAIRATRNVYVEICGSDPTAGMVEMAVREVGAERVLYGSDAAGRSYASQLAKVYGAEIPEEFKRLILRDNLRRLLGPALAARGVKR
jgi:predicted TIM-barrel fold metal-dependent hydrolase